LRLCFVRRPKAAGGAGLRQPPACRRVRRGAGGPNPPRIGAPIRGGGRAEGGGLARGRGRGGVALWRGGYRGVVGE